MSGPGHLGDESSFLGAKNKGLPSPAAANDDMIAMSDDRH